MISRRASSNLSPEARQVGRHPVQCGVALLFAVSFYARWDTYLRFRYGGSVGVADPLFGVDVGFYLFHLPFYELLQSSLMVLTALTLAASSLLTYMVFGLLRIRAGGKDCDRRECHGASLRAASYSGRRLGIRFLS
jgi:uncharacterized membrane protein (UPF0182 family)